MIRKYKILFIFSCAIFAALLSGCVETALVYDPNTYHTGRTNGDKKLHAQVSGGLGMQTRNSDDDIAFRTDNSEQVFTMGAELSQGVTGSFDLGGTAALGFANAGGSIGVRLFAKQMLTNPRSETAVSLMPAVVYIHGSRDTDPELSRKASSYLYAFEMHLPMSHRVHRRVSFVVEPKALFLFHRAHFKAGPNDYPPVRSRTVEDNWFCPGLALGMQLGPALPEVTILSVYGDVRVFGGIGVNF